MSSVKGKSVLPEASTFLLQKTSFLKGLDVQESKREVRYNVSHWNSGQFARGIRFLKKEG